ncbi:RHS repeat-associated core domain-containing protein [Pseudomonas sp. G.S.17]|uniref:RHS repeat domain-containing protein n=1 Tax=Pseudomonas sp. G.S.17 TaxID=3137451 RepID=UPI00311CA470
MTTSSAVHSNAFNFMGFMQHCVDPRTGQYTVSVDMPELKSNRLCGPAVPLQLQFNPLNVIDSGFGMGWNLNLSQFTPEDQMLALSSGENFKVTGSGAQPDIKEKKLDTFHFHDEGNETYRVVHKSGLVEILVTGGSSKQRVALPRTISSPSGHAVSLTYVPFNGGQLLSTVSDAFTTLLRVERDPGGSFVKLHLHPDSGPNGGPLATFEMKLNGDGEVTAIILPTPEKASWRFSYKQVFGRTCLVEVQTPAGGRETIEYFDQGHVFPGAPRDPLPRVNRHRSYPGFGQPMIEVNYSYTDNNFLGHNALQYWDDNGEDNLYNVDHNYDYGSVATLKDGTNTLRTVSRTYNRFHLQTEELTVQDHCVKRVLTDYHAEDTNFDNQPPQFQLPKTVTHRWELDNDANQLHIEVESTEFDEYGNLTSKVQANGIRETFSYYPKDGAEGCPPDPDGFVRNQHEHHTFPAASQHGQAAALRLVYTYRALPALENASDPGNWLVIAEETLTSSDDNHVAALQYTQRDYYDAPQDPAVHGRAKSQSETLNGKTSTTGFSYSTPPSALAGETVDQIVETLTAFDGTSKSVTLQQSLFTGKPLVVPDVNGVLLKYEYDTLNRVTLETVAPDTAFAASRHYAYTLTSQPGQQASQELTEVNGVKIRSTFDGLNRTILEECLEPGQDAVDYRKTYSATYDPWANLVSETDYDWLGTLERALTSTIEYDNWGHECRVVGPDGVATVTQRSPFGKRGVRQTTWIESSTQPSIKSGLSVTEFNVFNKPDSVVRQDETGATVGSLLYQYDGKGNCTQQTQQLSGRSLVTEYAFDAFERMTSTTLPDKTVVARSFADHSSSELPINIHVTPGNTAEPEVTPGTQAFDGLERLTQISVGPRVETYGYTGDRVQPSQRISPSKQVFEYTYDLDLTTQPRKISINGAAANEVEFSYDSQTARITGTSRVPDQPENQYTYDVFGHLQLQSRTGIEGKAQETRYVSSRQGRPMSSTVADGFETRYEYDDCGRVASVSQGKLQAEFTYNNLGQLQQSTTHLLDSDRTLLTKLEYDTLGRETRRTQHLPDLPVRTFTQTWYDDDQLHIRERLVGEQSVCKETFTYDSRGRLDNYKAEGSELSSDAHGNRITEQTFLFDALNNIKLCLSKFADGSSDRAIFTHAPDDSCQLIKVTHNHESYPLSTEFTYDADGHMLNDERGRQLSYNSQGRLTEVKGADDQPIIAYRYDGHDDLISVLQANGSETLRFFEGYSLSHTVHDKTLIQCLYDQDGPIGQQQQGDESRTLLFLTDASNSVIGERQFDNEVRTRSYSAYGEQADDELLSLLAFNGEVREEVGGWYLLGRGYRVYNPSLMRFHSPDSLSPFGAGGLNPYMYCMGNPISFSDPTGHRMGTQERPGGNPGYVDPIEQPKQGGGWTKWLGVGVAAVVLGVTVAFVPWSAPLATAGMKLAIGGIALQAVGLGLQTAGVITEDPNLGTAGMTVGGIGAMMTFGGAGVAKAAVKAAAAAKAGAAASGAGVATASVGTSTSPPGSISGTGGAGGGSPGPNIGPRSSATGANVRALRTPSVDYSQSPSRNASVSGRGSVSSNTEGAGGSGLPRASVGSLSSANAPTGLVAAPAPPAAAITGRNAITAGNYRKNSRGRWEYTGQTSMYI